jgi:hypothetical protein
MLKIKYMKIENFFVKYYKIIENVTFFLVWVGNLVFNVPVLVNDYTL